MLRHEDAQQEHLQALLEHLRGRGCVVNPQKIQGPGIALRFWELFGWIRCVMPEAVTDKVQAYPTSKYGKEVQSLVGIGAWRTFILHLV